ncbi:hypothetical protein JCM10450v2_003943 [Rhodotorula kratochvilovae]
MKSVVWSLLATAALAAPPFVLQGESNAAAAPAQHHLADLTVDDFHAVQDAFKDSLEHALDEGKRLVNDAFDLFDEKASEAPHHPPTHPLPPPVLDFSEYTILEIVNSTYGKHHHDSPRGRGFARKLRKGLELADDVGEHKPSPEHLPLNHLAWLINFSPEAAQLLEKDDITLLAPDNHALQNPHKRKEHGDKFAKLEDAIVEDHAGYFGAHVQQHPFHSRELSPKKLEELVDSDDDDDEEKKRIFKKIIAYVGKYHILPGKWHGRELADRSTVPTLIDESRVRVEPTLEHFPFVHPSLKFNSYANKRGPTIIAKNGVIHLIGEPLLPPLSTLNHIFLVPRYFGLFTNAAQKAELTGKDDERFQLEQGVDALVSPDLSDLDVDVDELVEQLAAESDVKRYTVFVPSNIAFARLPLKVAAFLHSPFPFAKKVLKYLLGYHIVPDIAFFSDYIKNGSSEAVAKYLVKEEIDVEVPLSWIVPQHEGRHPHPPPHAPEHPPFPRANITHYVLPTLLTHFSPNATLKVGVISHRLFGKGPIRRSIIVFPSHPPPHHDHDHDEKDRVARAYRKLTGGDEHGDHPPHPHPVKVAYADLPVRAGAVHVIGAEFLIPPPPPHHDEGDAELAAHGFTKSEAKKLRKLLGKLAA